MQVLECVNTRACRYSDMQVLDCIGTRVYKYSSMQILECIRTRVYRYSGIQLHRQISIRVCRYLGIQVRSYIATQKRKYTGMQEYSIEAYNVQTYNIQVYRYIVRRYVSIINSCFRNFREAEYFQDSRHSRAMRYFQRLGSSRLRVFTSGPEHRDFNISNIEKVTKSRASPETKRINVHSISKKVIYPSETKSSWITWREVWRPVIPGLSNVERVRTKISTIVEYLRSRSRESKKKKNIDSGQRNRSRPTVVAQDPSWPRH